MKSQRGQRFYFDALIIGAGLAGAACALEISQRYPAANIALIAKTDLQTANSTYAQGGIAAVSHRDDNFALHAADTFRAGAEFGEPDAINFIISQGPHAIDALCKFGVEFTRDNNQDFALTREGGHSARRILFHEDATGKAIMQTLWQQLANHKKITIFDYHTAVNLIPDPQNEKSIIGAYLFSEKQDCIHSFFAKTTLLATGGAGKVYRYTTNSEVATGDGLAMAYRAGARLANMAFYQFHPTLLYHQSLNHLLISEAVRGEGAFLRKAATGERFMQRYAPQAMELATRDIVARAIFCEIEKSTDKYVYLDARHFKDGFSQKRFPTIYQKLKAIGIDMQVDMIPVVPAAHYLCGGIVTDLQGHTDLNRLYAIGETAYTGLHGANRLASNSLLEAFVMAKQAANHCGRYLNQSMPDTKHIEDWTSQSVTDNRRASQIHAHWRGLRGEMTSYAGIIRTEAGLKDLLRLLECRLQSIEEYYWRHEICRDFIELRNIALVAKLVATAALARQESLGCHYREDFPTRQQTCDIAYFQRDEHDI